MHRASYRFMPFCGITETLSDVESVRVVHGMIPLIMVAVSMGVFEYLIYVGREFTK